MSPNLKKGLTQIYLLGYLLRQLSCACWFWVVTIINGYCAVFSDSTSEGVTDKPILDCCACGTAKYRLTFYGNWSEKTHPKDFPREYRSFTILLPYKDCEEGWNLLYDALLICSSAMWTITCAIPLMNSVDLSDILNWGCKRSHFQDFFVVRKVTFPFLNFFISEG